MKYKNIVKGKFIKRNNRFIAEVLINNRIELCHVKNTGRCRELLICNAEVFLEESTNPSRKTKYSLISVIKNGILINMDSQAPNKAVCEWLKSEKLFKNITLLKPEKTYKNSRFDFYLEFTEDNITKKCFIEVKGVTLENDGIVSFPDAPTSRGKKHLDELSEAVADGYICYVIFVIQMKNVKWFEPNYINDPDFAHALKSAQGKGVHITAFDCNVGKSYMTINKPVKIKI